jgi:hypothetical protein
MPVCMSARKKSPSVHMLAIFRHLAAELKAFPNEKDHRGGVAADRRADVYERREDVRPRAEPRRVEINGDPAADDDGAGKRAEGRAAVSWNGNLSGLEHKPLTRHTLCSGVRKGSPLRSARWRGATRP